MELSDISVLWIFEYEANISKLSFSNLLDIRSEIWRWPIIQVFPNLSKFKTSLLHEEVSEIRNTFYAQGNRRMESMLSRTLV